MIKCILIILSLLFTIEGWASLRMTQYRWRNDDGNQTTATWRAAPNTSVVLNNTTSNIRLRMEMDNDNGSGLSDDCDGILEYSFNNGTTWTEMTNAPTDHFIYAPSTFVTHNAVTTAQITGTPGLFNPGKIISNVPDINSWTSISDGGKMEYEWVLKPTNNARPGTKYLFRLYYYMDTPLNTPELTTGCVNVELLTTNGDIRCGSGTLTLSATAKSIVQVRWKDKNGNIVHNGFTYTTPVMYNTDTFYAEPYITYGNNQICVGTPMPVIASVMPGADVRLGNDTALCIGDSLILAASDPFYVSWVWSNNSTGDKLVVKTPGTYWVQVVTQTGCRLSDTINVAFNESPSLPLRERIDTCMNTGALITLDAQNPGSSYLWDNQHYGRVRVLSNSGTYHVKITNQYGCSVTDSSIINIKPNPKSALGNDTTICENASITLDGGIGSISYYWNTGETSRQITVDDDGAYYVYLTGGNGCIISDTIQITQNGNLPKYDRLQIRNEGPMRFKFEVTNPQYVIGYYWDFGDGSPIVYAQSPTHTYPSAGNFLVKGYVSSDCGVYYDTMSVHIYSTSVEDVSKDNKLTIYPNPTTDQVTIMTKDAGLNIQRVSILNILGQIIHQESITNLNSVIIPMKGLPAGTYQIILDTNQGRLLEKVTKY